MGSRQGIQEEKNKRKYVQQLLRLPLWNRTRVWGLHDVLQSCQVPAKSKKEKFGFDKQPEKIQQNRIKKGKDWIIWLSLVLVGLLLALIVTTLYLVNKKSHGHYHSREPNHRSKDH